MRHMESRKPATPAGSRGSPWCGAGRRTCRSRSRCRVDGEKDVVGDDEGLEGARLADGPRWPLVRRLVVGVQQLCADGVDGGDGDGARAGPATPGRRLSGMSNGGACGRSPPWAGRGSPAHSWAGRRTAMAPERRRRPELGSAHGARRGCGGSGQGKLDAKCGREMMTLLGEGRPLGGEGVGNRYSSGGPGGGGRGERLARVQQKLRLGEKEEPRGLTVRWL